jgi:hypothetical protein
LADPAADAAKLCEPHANDQSVVAAEEMDLRTRSRRGFDPQRRQIHRRRERVWSSRTVLIVRVVDLFESTDMPRVKFGVFGAVEKGQVGIGKPGQLPPGSLCSPRRVRNPRQAGVCMHFLLGGAFTISFCIGSGLPR